MRIAISMAPTHWILPVSLMYFCSDEPMHVLSGVDTRGLYEGCRLCKHYAGKIKCLGSGALMMFGRCPARSVTRLQCQAILSTGIPITSGHFRELEPRIVMRPDEESRSWRLGGLQKAFPPDLPRRTDKQIGRQGDLLACMTANREPSNRIELTGRRRFALRAVNWTRAALYQIAAPNGWG